jgi:2-hydroxychromene-2-carboxylate isomerase
MKETPMSRVAFYFDLGSPYGYLAAERLHGLLPAPIHWQPILLGGLFKQTGRGSWARGEREQRRAGMVEVERRAQSYGLPAVQWPDPWPSNYLFAIRAATFACEVGRGREFTLAAYRGAFRHGVDLSVATNVLHAGEQARLARAQLEAAAEDARVKQTLRHATQAAYELGVIGVPTIAIDDELFWGDDRLEAAAVHLMKVTVA